MQRCFPKVFEPTFRAFHAIKLAMRAVPVWDERRLRTRHLQAAIENLNVAEKMPGHAIDALPDNANATSDVAYAYYTNLRSFSLDPCAPLTENAESVIGYTRYGDIGLTKT